MMPEYALFNRVSDFYERIRAGKNLHKLDEIFYFLDEKSLEMTKRWIMDERFPWSIGKGWSLLSAQPPLVMMTMDAEQDRPGGQIIGNWAGDGVNGFTDSLGRFTPANAYEGYGRLMHATFNFFLVAPNADMISAMYLLTQRALLEGESPPNDESDIIPFDFYGIGELHYSGSDVRPDQNFLPNVAFGRSLSVSCTYLQQWRGKSFGKNGFISSIDVNSGSR